MSRAVTALVGAAVRRHRIALTAWCAGILALAAITVPAYDDLYGDPASRGPLVAGLEADAGMRLLYGRLRGSSLGELFVWEVGSYVVLLACVMAVLLAVSLTRAEEDAGTVDVVRAAGAPPAAPLLAALAVTGGAGLVVGGGSTAILLAQAGAYDELTARGALLFGGVATVAAWAFALVGVLAGQLRDSARGARGLAFAVLGAAFGLRVLADLRDDAAWLRWLTPLGWRDLVRPYTDDLAWPLAAMAGVVGALLPLVLVLERRRETGEALLGRGGASRRRLRVAGVGTWAWHGARGAVLGWSATVLGCAALFASMMGTMLQMIEEDPTVAAMMAQLTGGLESVTAMTFSYLGGFVALLVMVCAVTLTLRWREEERTGRLVHELAAGVPRRRTLLARVGVALTTATLLCGGAGLTLGLVGRAQLLAHEATGPGAPAVEELTARAAGQAVPWGLSGMVGQLPGILAAVGLTALLCACAPRRAGTAWAAVAYSGAAVFIGGLLQLPAWATDLGLLAHGPVPSEAAGASAWPDWGEWFLGWPLGLTAFGVVAILAALALVGRRDIATG